MMDDDAAGYLRPEPIGWFAAQKRPLAAAHIGAVAFLGVVVYSEGWPPAPPGRMLWPGFLYYAVFVLAFLLPLWLVQGAVFLQMRRRGRPVFVAPADVELLEAERRCRFLLSLRAHVFVLAVLYLTHGGGGRAWTRPAWLFLALFAAALLGFCLWTFFAPVLPPLFLLGTITFWSSSLVFGMSHLIRGD